MDLSTILGAGSAVLSVVGGASVLAAMLPRPAEGTALALAFKLLDILAANWMQARNAGGGK